MTGLTLNKRIQQLVKKHGGLRAAARAIQVDPAYLTRLGKGEKSNPSAETLRKLGLMVPPKSRAPVTYWLREPRISDSCHEPITPRPTT